jgi:hypothetical protein
MNTTWLSKAATGCAEGACLNVLVTIDPKSSFKCALSMSMTLLDFISPRINNLQAPNHPINIRIHQSQAPRHATWRERRTNRHAMSRCMIIHANQSYVEPCRLSVRRRQSFASGSFATTFSEKQKISSLIFLSVPGSAWLSHTVPHFKHKSPTGLPSSVANHSGCASYNNDRCRANN